MSQTMFRFIDCSPLRMDGVFCSSVVDSLVMRPRQQPPRTNQLTTPLIEPTNDYTSIPVLSSTINTYTLSSPLSTFWPQKHHHVLRKPSLQAITLSPALVLILLLQLSTTIPRGLSHCLSHILRVFSSYQPAHVPSPFFVLALCSSVLLAFYPPSLPLPVSDCDYCCFSFTITC